MPKPSIAAGVLALVALAAGIMASVDPLVNLQRAGIAYACGLVASHIWNALFALPEIEEPADDDESSEDDATDGDNQPSSKEDVAPAA